MRPDFNSADRANQIRLLAWAALGGTAGALFATLGSPIAGWSSGFVPVAGFLLGALVVYIVAAAVSGSLAGIVSSLFYPQARDAHRPADHSYAESLVVRGRYSEALEEYEHLAATNPVDPEPLLRIARLMRDRLNQSEGSVEWFARARDAATDAAAEEHVVRELVELLVRKLGRHDQAVVELARFVRRHAGEPCAEWARRDLTVLKRAYRDGPAEDSQL